ncbi:Hypothetical predicted protein, partial [Paramuricea clavata]
MAVSQGNNYRRESKQWYLGSNVCLLFGRHVWRCKAHVTSDAFTASPRTASDTGQERSNSVVFPELSFASLNNEHDQEAFAADHHLETDDHDLLHAECHCGKKCKSFKGLQAHRKHCPINANLDLNLLFAQDSDPPMPPGQARAVDSVENEETQCLDNSFQRIPVKPGLKLPKTPIGWDNANEYFRANLNISNEITDINTEISSLQDMIYTYFKSNFGTYNNEDDSISEGSIFQQKYNHLSRRQLKYHLSELKKLQCNEATQEIRYISKLLRVKYSKRTHRILSEKTHDERIQENFWKYCKEIFEDENTILPDFDKETCTSFFRVHLKANSGKGNVEIPQWMKKFDRPTKHFNIAAPSYREVTNIIKKMKPGSSACPFDQISIIILKRCPFLRTALHRILVYCWEGNVVPRIWKHGFTILIHKKDSPQDPSNFRPITLQPVFGKVFTSIIRNRIYSFLMDNKYIETKIQKGFWEEVSGTIEHIELLTHIINHARNNKRHLIVTLLDLKNAFVGKGVLQGDCLSPLLFNMCVNTLIKCIEDERVQCIGYSYCEYLRPRHWFQFADDTALVTTSEEDNQALLDVFTKWCRWAGFQVRVNKCSTFGIKHNGKKATPFKPYLKVNNQMIPQVEINESFQYLGKQFNYKMDTVVIEQELEYDLLEYLEKINRLPLHPRNKILIITKYVYSKLRWRLSIYRLSQTWVEQHLDNKIISYIKRWLHFHKGANMTHLKLASSKLGVGLQLASDVYRYCKLSIRKILSKSINNDMRCLFNLTKFNNVQTDCLIYNNDNPRSALKQQIENTVVEHLSTLKEQNTIMKHARQHIKAEKYRQFGFSFKLLNPIHWFQFADDAAVITGQEFENQHLLNRFSIWCQWSDIIIRVDKCSTFGIKKAITKSVQYLPKLLISNQLIPKITIGESFQYLGRYFDFHMSNDNHKTELTSLLNELMSDIDSKPLHPKNKLLLYSRYVLSKLAWHFTVATLSKTWVTENIDSVANKYIRRWLEVPISGTLSTVFLTNNKFGLSIYPPSVKFIQCQTVLRKALKSSLNESTNDLWRATSNHTNIQYDAYNSTKEVLKDFRSGHENKLLNQLTSQGSFFCSVTKFALPQLSK